jgi:hypothetical protein
MTDKSDIARNEGTTQRLRSFNAARGVTLHLNWGSCKDWPTVRRRLATILGNARLGGNFVDMEGEGDAEGLMSAIRKLGYTCDKQQIANLTIIRMADSKGDLEAYAR